MAKKRQFAVIGLGKFGFKAAETLAEQGVSVLGIDKDEAIIERAQGFLTEALILDSTDEEVLEASGVKDVDAVVVGMGDNVEASLLTVTLLKKMGIKEIIARANSDSHARILRALGVKKVVLPEEDMGVRIGKSIITALVREYIELGGEYVLVEIEVKPGNKLIGKSLKELDLRAKYHIVVLLIQKITKKAHGGEEEELVVTREFPAADYEIREKDILVVIGERKAVQDFEKLCASGIKEK